jgi:hypothetical protein
VARRGPSRTAGRGTPSPLFSSPCEGIPLRPGPGGLTNWRARAHRSGATGRGCFWPQPADPSSALDSEHFRPAPRTSPCSCGSLRGKYPPTNEKGRAMDERTSDQSRGSDTLAKVFYPSLLFVVMLLWVYVPA